MKRFVALALLFLGFQASQAFAFPVVVTDNGKLVGVNNLLVQDGSYSATFNVTFLDGTCVSLYSGCDDISDLPLVTHARAGFDALISEIGAFLSNPERIRGCASYEQCYIITPSSIDLSTGQMNINGLLVDWATGRDGFFSMMPGELRTTDLATVDSRTYAVWTQVAPPVPLPAAGWLLVSAVAVLGRLGVRRRQARAST